MPLDLRNPCDWIIGAMLPVIWAGCGIMIWQVLSFLWTGSWGPISVLDGIAWIEPRLAQDLVSLLPGLAVVLDFLGLGISLLVGAITTGICAVGPADRR